MDRSEEHDIAPSTLRLLWNIIEESRTGWLIALSDTEMVRQLMKQLEARLCLSDHDSQLLQDYLYARTSLIRDLAEPFQARSRSA